MELTEFNYADLVKLEKWMQDKELLKKIKTEAPCREKHMEFYAIRNKRKELVGWIELFNIDFENFKAELGFAIPENKYRYLAKQAIDQILKYAFSDLKLNRVYARILATNDDVIENAISYGFTKEGVERESCINGDIVVLSILKSEVK